MKNVIWTNGVFDILHPGHIELLKISKSLGDYLVVGLDSDRRVKELKGDSRPINKWLDRKTVLEAIQYVDLVVGFDSDAEIEMLIRLFQPSVVVDNPDWSPSKTPYLPGGIEVRKFGLLEGFSSSRIIERIRNS